MSDDVLFGEIIDPEDDIDNDDEPSREKYDDIVTSSEHDLKQREREVVIHFSGNIRVKVLDIPIIFNSQLQQFFRDQLGYVFTKTQWQSILVQWIFI